MLVGAVGIEIRVDHILKDLQERQQNRKKQLSPLRNA